MQVTGQSVEGEPEDEFEPGPAWDIPWHAKVPAYALVALFALAYIAHRGHMIGWAISAQALAQGRYDTILLHMFAHGGLLHIGMNSFVLLAIGGAVTARLGPPPESWLRFLALFLLSGLAGAFIYIAFHPRGGVPMLGASGAIYGVLGLLLRLPPPGEPLVGLFSPELRDALVGLLKANIWLIVILMVPAILSGGGGGLAWEAHLGGLLFGLICGPWLLPYVTPDR